MKISHKWWAMAKLYERFAGDGQLDFSHEAAEAMYRYESMGGQQPVRTNGYLIGKQWMDVTVAMWREDLRPYLDGLPILFRAELEADYPAGFLNRVLA